MQKNNFSYMLIALLIFIVAVPIAHDLELVSLRTSRAVAIFCLLVIGVWSLRYAGRLFTIGMSVVILGVILNIWAFVSENNPLHIASLLILIAFLLVAIFTDLRQVAVVNDLSPNRIIGAICVYLMLGVIWSIAYSVLEFSQPGSFRGLTEVFTPGWNPDWIYFSFVTLTTLGYGDITPATQTARSLAIAEAIVGQFYIAVLVAGLVSAYMSARSDDTDTE